MRAFSIVMLSLFACATAPERRKTLADELPPDVISRVKAIHDDVLMDWLASTEFNESSADAVRCRLGSCISCIHAREVDSMLPRDKEWVDRWILRCDAADVEAARCSRAIPGLLARERLALAATMAPKDPVDACEHFRAAELAASCRKGMQLGSELEAFAREHPRACVRADLFAADGEVIEARRALAQKPDDATRERLRALLNRKRVEYRDR